MNAIDVARAVLAGVPDALVVPSLGTAVSALRAASDDGPHLYLGGSMGSALAVALGVAHRRPERPVVALLGDGEAAMGAGSFWSLAGLAPANLLVVVLADGHYSITGGQRIAVPQAWADVARALGLRAAVVEEAAGAAGVEDAVRTVGRPGVVEVRYSERTWPGPSPFVDPPVVRARFEAEATRALA